MDEIYISTTRTGCQQKKCSSTEKCTNPQAYPQEKCVKQGAQPTFQHFETGLIHRFVENVDKCVDKCG